MKPTVLQGTLFALGAALVLAGSPAAADNLYKWKDKDGKVHYTDQPPPPEANTTERKKFGDAPGDVPVPYVLQQAMKNFPVTLYTADCGDACDRALAYLQQRRVPFKQKNAREEAAGQELKALTGGKLEVPVLKVGKQVLRGYQENDWKLALYAAGYPGPLMTTPEEAPAAPAPKSADAPKPAAANTTSKPAQAKAAGGAAESSASR